MIFKCNKCIYITNIKCNLKRHCVRKHNCEYNEEEPEAQNVSIEQQNVNIETPKVAEKTLKVAKETPKVAEETPNVATNEILITPNENSFQCNKCLATFTRNWSLKRHEKNCNGNKNICELCNQILKDKNIRYKHKQTCNGNTTINNITNNNITNNTINNNNNNTFIVFNINDSNPIEFSDKHLDNPSILQKIFSKEDFAQILSNYSHRIFEKPENRIIKKTNMRSYNSDVYMPEEDMWMPMLDCDIYFKIARGISSSALVLTDKNNVDIEPMYKDNLQQIQVDCEISPDKGFEDPEMKYSRTTRKGIQIIKNVVNSVTPKK